MTPIDDPRGHVNSAGSRRRFLKQAALAAGAGLAGAAAVSSAHPEHPIIPACGRGPGPTPPKDDEAIRLGVIGVG